MLKVMNITDTEIHCEVIHGGILTDRKGINIPEVDIQMEYLSDQDKSDLVFAAKEGVDYVAASFMRTADDAKAVRNFLCLLYTSPSPRD